MIITRTKYGKGGKLYHLSIGQWVTLNELTEIICEATGTQIARSTIEGRMKRHGIFSPLVFAAKGHCLLKKEPPARRKARGEFDRTTYCLRHHQPCRDYMSCLDDGFTAAKKAWPEVLGCFKHDERSERIHGNQS